MREVFLLILAVTNFHSSVFSISPFFVVFIGSFCLWVQSRHWSTCPTPSQLSWHCADCSPASAAQPPGGGGHPPGHTFCNQVCSLLRFATRERSRNFPLSKVCTEASPFSSSVCVEVSDSTWVDRGDTPAGAAAFTQRQVPNIFSRQLLLEFEGWMCRADVPFCVNWCANCCTLHVPVCTSWLQHSWPPGLPEGCISITGVGHPSLVSCSHALQATGGSLYYPVIFLLTKPPCTLAAEQSSVPLRVTCSQYWFSTQLCKWNKRLEKWLSHLQSTYFF